MIETAVEKFAGKGAKAHMIKIGPSEFYFTGSHLFAIRRNGELSISDEYVGHPGVVHRDKLREANQLGWNDNRMNRDTFATFALESLGLLNTDVNQRNLRSCIQIQKFAGDGANAVALKFVDGKTFYFSYDNLIAIRDEDTTLHVSEDVWGRTVKKHINLLGIEEDDRMPRAEFEAYAEESLAQFTRIPKIRWYRNVPNPRRS